MVLILLDQWQYCTNRIYVGCINEDDNNENKKNCICIHVHVHCIANNYLMETDTMSTGIELALTISRK